MERWKAAAQLLTAATCLAGAPTSALGQWPAGKTGYWGKLSVFRHTTETQYRADGSEQPFLNTGAKSESWAVFFDVLYGVTDHLDLWAQVPYFDLSFDDVSRNRDASGIGDVRFMARYHLFSLRQGAIPIAVRGGFKVPILDSPIDAEIIPVGEGQWDFELWLEGGVSFWPIPAYGVIWLGHRWRRLNEKTAIDPGNEKLLLAELGGTVVGRLGVKLTLDALFGLNPVVQGILTAQSEREIVYFQPSLTFAITSSTSLEWGPRFPLHGQNHPAGTPLQFAVFHRVDPPGA